jgi:hypothetical protein
MTKRAKLARLLAENTVRLIAFLLCDEKEEVVVVVVS